MRGRVGSEAAPDNERGRTISGPTNPTASQPPPSSADTSVRWALPCLATWQGAVRGFPGGVGTYRGSRGAAPGLGRGTDGPRGVRGKAPRVSLQVGQQGVALLLERGDSHLCGVERCGVSFLVIDIKTVRTLVPCSRKVSSSSSSQLSANGRSCAALRGPLAQMATSLPPGRRKSNA